MCKLSYGIFRWEPAIAAYDWFFAPIRTSTEELVPHLIGPPWEVIPTSPCARIDHAASGLADVTHGSFLPVPVKVLAFATAPFWLASPHPQTPCPFMLKGCCNTRSCLSLFAGSQRAATTITIRFQVLFTLSSRVLFNFRSRYYTLSVSGSI